VTTPLPADTPQTLIAIDDLRYRYPGAAGDALAGLQLHVCAGELVVIVGANGSGKSTLARILGGLERPSSARLALACGHDLLSDEGRLAARREIGVLFQNPDNQIIAQTVEEDVAFGLENLAWPPADMQSRVEEMLAWFHLEELRTREPHLLSGGQKQRVALAGVLAIPRRVVVLDEPTAMLDPIGRKEVLAAVAELRAEGLAIVLITQEMAEVVGADRVIALERGRTAFSGAATDLFTDTDLVRRLRLGLPAPAELALALIAHGRDIPRLTLTVDELLEELAGPA
jgi:energy-coupling factor transport system ATP-binding protein